MPVHQTLRWTPAGNMTKRTESCGVHHLAYLNMHKYNDTNIILMNSSAEELDLGNLLSFIYNLSFSLNSRLDIIKKQIYTTTVLSLIKHYAKFMFPLIE